MLPALDISMSRPIAMRSLGYSMASRSTAVLDAELRRKRKGSLREFLEYHPGDSVFRSVEAVAELLAFKREGSTLVHRV